jgi:hypothetical protein
MSNGDVREQLINGFQKAQLGLDKERIKSWVSSELENENRGALAAFVFYGACIRECMTRKIDDPIQAHWIALGVLASFEDNDYDEVFTYMIGRPLPERVSKVIEYYKENLQTAASDVLKMINNLEVNITVSDNDFDDDIDNDTDDFNEEFDIDFDEEDDTEQ